MKLHVALIAFIYKDFFQDWDIILCRHYIQTAQSSAKLSLNFYEKLLFNKNQTLFI